MMHEDQLTVTICDINKEKIVDIINIDYTMSRNVQRKGIEGNIYYSGWQIHGNFRTEKEWFPIADTEYLILFKDNEGNEFSFKTLQFYTANNYFFTFIVEKK